MAVTRIFLKYWAFGMILLLIIFAIYKITSISSIPRIHVKENISSVSSSSASVVNKALSLSTSHSHDYPALQDLSLFTEPVSGMAPILSRITHATRSIDLVMYECEDPQLETALESAENRGVKVRVILNGGYWGKPDYPDYNKYARNAFLRNDVLVRNSPSYFALTHQKTLIVDGKTAIIMTFNFTPQYYSTSRDFGVIDTDPRDVSAIEHAFDVDWKGEKVNVSSGDNLLWSPGSEKATISLIKSAKRTLEIYNEEMQDPSVVNAIANVAKRGVNVRIVMTDQSDWHTNFNTLASAGVHIHLFSPYAPLYIHAKVIVVDGVRAFIGSENFSQTSLKNNRELGVVTSNHSVINKLETVFNGDYKKSVGY